MRSSSQNSEAIAAKLHIEEIRKHKFSIGERCPNPLTEDLQNAVANLSSELYTKDVHFLMELIQVYLSVWRIKFVICYKSCFILMVTCLEFLGFFVLGGLERRRQRVFSRCEADSGVCTDNRWYNRNWCTIYSFSV